MGFSDEGQILMKNLYVLKDKEQKNLVLNRGWGLRGLNKLFYRAVCNADAV